jgi:hypothetical protein
MGAAEIPATFGGLALFNVANALAAVAMAYAAGITPPAIRAGLQGFSRPSSRTPVASTRSTRMGSGSSWITLTIPQASQPYATWSPDCGPGTAAASAW